MLKLVVITAVLSGLIFVVQSQSQTCLVCQSPTNPNCADPEASEYRQVCEKPQNASCYTRIVDGNVERGCLSSLDSATIESCDSNICQICRGINNSSAGDDCNIGLFPQYRLKCHQCQGPVNGTCSGVINSTPLVCPIFDAEDRCYTARPEGNYERGCLSSTKLCDGTSCGKCQGHGCNFNDYNSANDIHSIKKVIYFGILSLVVMAFSK